MVSALIADGSKEAAHHLFEFGLNIGLAFQIQDDFLEIYSSESSMSTACCLAPIADFLQPSPRIDAEMRPVHGASGLNQPSDALFRPLGRLCRRKGVFSLLCFLKRLLGSFLNSH